MSNPSLHRGIGMTSLRTRERMVKRLREQGVRNLKVLDAMLNTPRHLFLEEALASRAYDDTALPIGYNQTISQPLIVALMTELLIADGIPQKVLEIGTGSGYQTAILAQIVPQVYSLERILPLQRRARKCLQNIQLHNIQYKYSDGHGGWPEHAPYDAILVAAASTEIPPKLLEQISPGGVMILPVGAGDVQTLQKITKTDQACEVETLERVSFVPMLSGCVS